MNRAKREKGKSDIDEQYEHNKWCCNFNLHTYTFRINFIWNLLSNDPNT